jgi:hypothetical protein
MGSIPKNVQNISPEFLSPIEMTNQGKLFGIFIPMLTTGGSWASGSL